ncbi:MAG TPA: radical SAM protein [Candidatus Wallbacteria bacterium]|nr:radical SAM protein [Candidatus Wallbacteria bacterium]
MIIFREEKFGGILFDTETMSYKFVETLNGEASAKIGRRIPLFPGCERPDIVSAPVQVYIELTKKCNLNCRHCFTGAAGTDSEGEPAGVWISILDELHSIGVINVRFTGGEPTVKNGWHEILSHAKKLGFAVSLQTNGIYSDAAGTVEKIAGLALEQVTVSLDGIGRTHDELRGAGSFEKLMASMKLMKAAGIKLRFNTILTKANSAEMPQIFEIVKQYGTAVNLFYMRSLGKGAGNSKISLDFCEHAESAKQALELWKKFPEIHVSHSGFYSPKSAGARNPKFPDVSFPYGNIAISISSDAGYWPHHYSIYQGENFRLGGYPNDRIIDVWRSSKKLDGFRRWLLSLRERCEKCIEYRDRCSGINFEMEIEKLSGRSAANPFCVNAEPAPRPLEYLED